MRVLLQPCPTCLLFFLALLTCTEAQTGTIIKNVTLSVFPAGNVERGVNLTLTCSATASHASGFQPPYKYSFFKDFLERELADVTPTDNVEHAIYSIPNARAVHSGTYQCKVVVDRQHKQSNPQEIQVNGLQTPVLEVDRTKVREGEAVSATCRAEEELGLLKFSIKDNGMEVHREESNSGRVQHMLSLYSVRTANLSCSYLIITGLKTLQSHDSNIVSVAVQELDITPSITVYPQTGVIEGDQVHITCNVTQKQQNLGLLSLNLVKGNKIIKFNMNNNTYSKVVQATDSGEYECSAEMEGVQKSSSMKLTVRELFSQPKVTITPSDVFESQYFAVNCYSENIASEKIRRDDVKYSILRNEDNITLGQFNGVYKAVAGTKTNGNYTCSAQVYSIIKRSTSVPFKAKVLVSSPVIKAVGRVILGRPFQILCWSETGSFPINYTLKWNHVVRNHSVLMHPEHQALFPAIINSEAEIHSFTCEAQNNKLGPPLASKPLSAIVTVLVQETFLTVVPTPEDIAEGHDIYLICSARKGTLPITFRWYHQGFESPLSTSTVWSNSSSHTIKEVRSENSGTYYCEAQNYGSDRVLSNMVNFTVNMARWKKALIIGMSLLGVALVVIFLLIRYGAKRGKRETAVELSVKPASPKSDDSIISRP